MKKNIRSNRRVSGLGLLAGFFLLCFEVSAQHIGRLDSSFGINGKVVSREWGNQRGRSIAVQQDGKIIMVGTNDLIGLGSPHFIIVRYHSNGLIDSTFGNNGKVLTAIGTSSCFASAVAIHKDGKIVVAGYSFNGTDYDYALVRCNIDGSLDASFGNAGIVTTNIANQGNYARSIVIQEDDKLLVAGDSYFSSTIVRYHSNGTLDASFGNGGVVTTTLNPFFWSSLDYLAIQEDGKIVAGGYYGIDISRSDFAMARFKTNGELDPDFGSGGVVITSVGEVDLITSIALQKDGKITAGGSTRYFLGYEDFVLVRYTAGGSLDHSFGERGKVVKSFSDQNDNATAIRIQSDGKILEAGYTSINSNIDFIVVRYNPNGLIDSSFGVNGIIQTDFGSNYDLSNAMILQKDGKILLAGETNADTDFALARYIVEGTSDSLVTTSCLEAFLYPNPTMDGVVSVQYRLLKDEKVSIYLFDVAGRYLAKLMDNERRSKGSHKEHLFLPRSLAVATYIVQIKTNDCLSGLKFIRGSSN